MPQTNPKCPKCDTNRRVIVSHKKSAESGFFNLALSNPKALFQCNICQHEFFDRRVNA